MAHGGSAISHQTGKLKVELTSSGVGDVDAFLTNSHVVQKRGHGSSTAGALRSSPFSGRTPGISSAPRLSPMAADETAVMVSAIQKGLGFGKEVSRRTLGKKPVTDPSQLLSGVGAIAGRLDRSGRLDADDADGSMVESHAWLSGGHGMADEAKEQAPPPSGKLPVHQVETLSREPEEQAT